MSGDYIAHHHDGPRAGEQIAVWDLDDRLRYPVIPLPPGRYSADAIIEPEMIDYWLVVRHGKHGLYAVDTGEVARPWCISGTSRKPHRISKGLRDEVRIAALHEKDHLWLQAKRAAWPLPDGWIWRHEVYDRTDGTRMHLWQPAYCEPGDMDITKQAPATAHQ